MTTRDHDHCTFIPPWLAERVAAGQLAADRELRAARASADRSVRAVVAADAAAWTVHDAGSTTRLPGALARSAGESATGDPAVDEAADGVTATLEMWAQGFGRDSFDGAGAPVSLTVHYGSAYDNAFWDGTQLVFGDGDGRVFDRFTKPVDVLAHEFGHAVVEHTCDLAYEGQSGALNESVADAFASCLKQRVLDQDAAAGDWLIGQGIFLPSVQARALRDMAAPGTAYDDPDLGADPQVGHMDDYVDTTDDNGGVHLNSGIPNKAFQLAAVAIGGSAVEGAGRIWYAALTGGGVPSTADFAQFAAATVAAAGDHADAVAQAWAQVGVEPSAAGGPVRPAPVGSSARTLRVERTGGFAGRTESAEVDLDDPAVADLRGLVAAAGIDTLRPPADPTPKPDMFVYGFRVDGGDLVRVPEHLLTGAQAEVARRVLRSGGGVS